ncbi:cell wall protein Ecm33 [Entomophthora muscae]|uniref:Cell wall protein Ecm33 n=1 Tax=Entomophthora muscae TaxID=34485 RepID=A0ACC2UGP9_9FUNG|nr:cell wall protein Ecm33 [Entomophthora muscae]
MKLQIFNFILLAVGTPVENLITCNVPDGKPSSIPQDCQVCLDTIVVTNDKSTWPAKELALKEIKTLSIQADLPPLLQIPLRVRTLEISGFIPENIEVKNITAKMLFVNRVCGEASISFGDFHPHDILIDNSRVNISGISSSSLSMFSAISSNLQETSLPNLKSAGSVSLDGCTFDAEKLFPNLQTVHDLNFKSSEISGFNLSIVSVSGNLEVLSNIYLSSVDFPDLKNVYGEVIFTDNSRIQTLDLSSLTKARKIDISGTIDSIVLPLELTWKEESYFNAGNFCEDYNTEFRASGLKFNTPGVCVTYCNRPIKLTQMNYAEFMKCKVAHDLILDGNPFYGTFELPNLQEISGSLALINSTQRLRMSSLRRVEGLYLIGSSSFSKDSASNLEVSSLKVMNNANQCALEFNTLRLTNELVITNSVLERVSGINATALKKVTITNNPNLWKLRLENLTDVHDVRLVNNPKLGPLENSFPHLGNIEGSLHIEKSNSFNIKIPVKNVQENIVLINNPSLENVEMPHLVKNLGSLISRKNPNFVNLLVSTGNITIQKGVDTLKTFP